MSFSTDYRADRKNPKLTRSTRKNKKTAGVNSREEKAVTHLRQAVDQFIKTGVMGSSDPKDYQVSVSGNLNEKGVDAADNGQVNFMYISVTLIPGGG